MTKPKLKIKPFSEDKYNSDNSFLLITPRIVKEKDGIEKKTATVETSIENWENLTEQEKTKIAWIWNLCSKKGNFSSNDYNSYCGIGKKTGGGFSFPLVYNGGGIAWLEPFIYGMEGPTNSPKNGVFVQICAQPKVYGYEWREYNENNQGAIIERVVKYGETIQLHIYTDGMYGEDIDITIYDDYDQSEDLPLHEKNKGKWQTEEGGDTDFEHIKKDKLPSSFKTMQREVLAHKHDIKPKFHCNKVDYKDEINKTEYTQYQKCVTNIYIDPVWSFYANRESGKVKENPVGLRIMVSMRGTDFKIEERENKPIIRVLDGIVEKSLLTDVGNKPVIVGEVETNYVNFLPCKYSEVKGNYNRGSEKMTMQIFPLENEPSPKRLVFPLVAGVKEARQDFSVELKDVKTDNCNFEGKEKDHTGHVIDISKIEKRIEQGKGKRSKKWRAIDYQGKGSGEVKDEKAGDENDNQEPDESHISQILSFKNGGSTIKAQESFKVLEEYTPFVLEPPTDELLQLQVGYDFTWGKKINPLTGLAYTIWPNNKGIAQNYPVNLNTCAYSLPLDILVYPDTKWTMQLAFNYDADKFNELREEYHEKWELKKLEAKEDAKAAKEQLKKLERKSEGEMSRKKRAELEAKRRQKEIERKKAKEAKKQAKKNTSKRGQASQAVHMMKPRNAFASNLIGCEFNLMCEFDRPYQALELSSAFDEMIEFIKKIIGIKELVENIAHGKNGETNKNAPKEQGKQAERKKKLETKLEEKKAKKGSNWSVEVIPPSIGLSVSWYAEAPKDLQKPVMGTLIEGAIEMDPLFGIEFTYDVYQLLYKIKHPAVLAVVATLDILDEALEDNFDINLDLVVTSEISGELKGTINTAAGSGAVARMTKDEDDSPAKIGGKVEVSLKGEMQANGELKVFVFWKRKAYIQASAEIKTGISVECVTKADRHGIYVEPEIKFEGLILEAKINLGFVSDDADTNNVEELKEIDGIHYTAEGKIVILDPYEWETGWKLPILST